MVTRSTPKKFYNWLLFPKKYFKANCKLLLCNFQHYTKTVSLTKRCIISILKFHYRIGSRQKMARTDWLRSLCLIESVSFVSICGMLFFFFHFLEWCMGSLAPCFHCILLLARVQELKEQEKKVVGMATCNLRYKTFHSFNSLCIIIS